MDFKFRRKVNIHYVIILWNQFTELIYTWDIKPLFLAIQCAAYSWRYIMQSYTVRNCRLQLIFNICAFHICSFQLAIICSPKLKACIFVESKKYIYLIGNISDKISFTDTVVLYKRARFQLQISSIKISLRWPNDIGSTQARAKVTGLFITRRILSWQATNHYKKRWI